MTTIMQKIAGKVQGPQKGMYEVPRPSAKLGGLAGYGIDANNDAAYGMRVDAASNRYAQDLEEANAKQSVLAQIAMQKQAEMDRRKQDLDYGAKVRDRIPQEAIMRDAGLPIDGISDSDNIMRQSQLAKLAKQRQPAQPRSNAGGDDGKSPVSFETGDTGIMKVKVTDPRKVAANPELLKMLPAEMQAALSGQPQSPSEKLSGQKRGAQATQPEQTKVAPQTAAPAAPTVPQTVITRQGKFPLVNAVQQADGSFIGTVVTKGQKPVSIIVNPDGSFKERVR